MIIQFHIPRSVGAKLSLDSALLKFNHPVTLYDGSATIDVDSETVTDEELAKLSTTRQAFNDLIPRDLIAELELRVAALEKGG